MGRIGRAHGLGGEAVVVVTTDIPERRFVPDATLERDDASPLVVASARADSGRWVVRFHGVEDREAARALTGTVLYAPPIDDPDTWWVSDLVGASVVDCAGNVLGTVVGVLANPAADLLELETGALVPVNFVEERKDDGTLVVDPPEGLFDL